MYALCIFIEICILCIPAFLNINLNGMCVLIVAGNREEEKNDYIHKYYILMKILHSDITLLQNHLKTQSIG